MLHLISIKDKDNALCSLKVPYSYFKWKFDTTTIFMKKSNLLRKLYVIGLVHHVRSILYAYGYFWYTNIFIEPG